MTRRKDELSPAAIDRGWPHQVALAADPRDGLRYRAILEFCRELSLCARGHSVFHTDQTWDVFCFAVKDHADAFRARFGGEPFDPADRGRGSAWMQWRNGPAPAEPKR